MNLPYLGVWCRTIGNNNNNHNQIKVKLRETVQLECYYDTKDLSPHLRAYKFEKEVDDVWFTKKGVPYQF